MAQRMLSPGPLLDGQGRLAEAGYATQPVRLYDRAAIRASRLRVKEWDYYLMYNDRFGLALTLADNGYMGLLSASLLHFGAAAERTETRMFWLPLGKTGLPASSDAGISAKTVKGAQICFETENGARLLRCRMDDFGGRRLEAEIALSAPPRDSMVIATPFPGKPRAFYYNRKIIGMRAEGIVRLGAESYRFERDGAFGLLDWGRGVWNYESTWLWSAGQGLVRGHVVGFNLGYGFGDTSSASENMAFVDGVAHKLDRVEFRIPQTADGGDDFLSPWTFASSDGRFEAEFLPILDRAAKTDLGLLLSDQHQVFGRFNGQMRLDDGTIVPLRDFLGFAEKVHNKW